MTIGDKILYIPEKRVGKIGNIRNENNKIIFDLHLDPLNTNETINTCIRTNVEEKDINKIEAEN